MTLRTTDSPDVYKEIANNRVYYTEVNLLIREIIRRRGETESEEISFEMDNLLRHWDWVRSWQAIKARQDEIDNFRKENGLPDPQSQQPLNPNGTPQTSRWFDQVKAFTEAMGQPVGEDIKSDKNEHLVYLRTRLIREESKEVEQETLCKVCRKIDKAALTKELADLLYVTIGFAVTFGLPLCEVFERVHQSNMSKLGEDGKPIYREDGKVMKGPNYQPPQLDDLF